MSAEVEYPSPVHPAEPATGEWMGQAACKGRTSLFFGLAGERPERRIRREARARKVCGTCPVQWPCRTNARVNRENGFWGGESEEERAAAGYPPALDRPALGPGRQPTRHRRAGADPGHRLLSRARRPGWRQAGGFVPTAA